MGIAVGDLVQFKQEKTYHRKCWSVLPINYDYFRSWKPLLQTLNIEKIYGIYWMAHFPEWRATETQKIPMILSDFETRCYTDSKLAFVQKTLTKSFAKVTVFQQQGEFRTVPIIFWVLVEDIENFSDKSYLQEFKEKLRRQLGEQKNAC